MNLPFTTSAFLEVFARYNAALWPIVGAVWVATVWASIALLRGRANPLAISALVAAQWLWSGAVYHAIYFSPVNPAAWAFAVLFVLEGLALLWHGCLRARLTFSVGTERRQIVAGAFLMLSVIYPALAMISGHAYPRVPLAAVPCPTALFTTGVLLLAIRPPRVLFVAPVIWSFIGGSAAITLNMPPDVALFAGGFSLLWYVRRGRSVSATPLERSASLAGDDLIGHSAGSLTHAVTIFRPARDVWPWLAQMGAGTRAGWYSYDALDNGRRPSAETIVPELQSIEVGTLFPALPGEKNGFVVLQFEKDHCLVLGFRPTPRAPLTVTWAFVLVETGGVTRLVVRARGADGYQFQGLPEAVSVQVVRVVHFIMQRRQLLNIARRVESAAPSRGSGQPYEAAA